MDLSQAIADAAAASIPPELLPPASAEAPAATDDAEAVRSDAFDSDAAVESATVTPEAETEENALEAAEDAIPEGYAAPAVLTDGLAAEFTLLSGDDEIEVPALTVKFKANGKMREERLDQVVRLAQFGVYNAEREEKLKAIEGAVTERDTLQQTLAEREAQLERLLTDDAFLEAARDAYAKEMSPEAEAKRAKEEVQSLRVQQQMEKIQAEGQRFYEQEAAPALDMIAKACPSVTQEELEAQFTMALQAHAEEAPNGQPYVPPSRYEAIRQYLVDTLAVWALAQHTRRSASRPAPATPAPAASPATNAAKVADQQAKRAVGQITKPVGSTTTAPDRPKPSAAPATIDDAVSSALDSALASFR